MGVSMSPLWNFAKLLFALVSWMVTGVFWLFHGAKVASQTLTDVQDARRTMRDGALRCPDGHIILPSGIFECGACGWRWRDHAWGLVCPNPECPRPLTSYIQCTTCGLSVRNPSRWGRP